MDENKHYIFYDGDCGFCNHWVQWVLERDKKDEFLFAALQSDFGQQFLKDRGLDTKNLDTLYLWKPKEYYLTKSAAVTKIAKILGGGIGFLAHLNVFPQFMTDKIYDQVAKNRQQLGAQQCINPTANDRKKFIN